MNQNFKFETLCPHAGDQPNHTMTSSGVAVHRTPYYVFKSTQHASDLMAIKEPEIARNQIGKVMLSCI